MKNQIYATNLENLKRLTGYSFPEKGMTFFFENGLQAEVTDSKIENDGARRRRMVTYLGYWPKVPTPHKEVVSADYFMRRSMIVAIKA